MVVDVCTDLWIKVQFLTHWTILLISCNSCMHCVYLEKEWDFIYKNTVSQRCRNPSHLVTQVTKFYVHSFIHSFIRSFHWHVQNATIPCRSQELFPFLSVIYFFLPPFSTNYSSILPHFILPSVSWSASQFCCFPNSYVMQFWELYFLYAQTNIIYLTLLFLL